MDNYTAEKTTARWLKQNGISAKHFADTNVLLLQAQRVAHNTLKTYPNLLSTEQISTLQAFIKAAANQKTQAQITTTQAYQALNIGSKIRRQVFRQRRAFN